MNDAELIYDALLRAERRLEPTVKAFILTPDMMPQLAAYNALQTLREEIGSGLAKRASASVAPKQEG